MPVFKKYEPSSEKELHGIIGRELDSLEEGLELLKYEMSIGKGIPDFLCKDSGGRIVIIEVKLNEDENILFQALRYYADVNMNRYVLAEMFSKRGIDPKVDPRIILVAKHFSDDIRLLATLLVPEVELYEYSTLTDTTGAKGVIYHAVSLPKLESAIYEPAGIDDHRSYITNTSLHNHFDDVRNEIRSLDLNIEEYVTQNYIGYKYLGRQVAWIGAQRKSFDVGAISISDKRETLDSPTIRVNAAGDDISEILNQIQLSCQNLKQ